MTLLLRPRWPDRTTLDGSGRVICGRLPLARCSSGYFDQIACDHMSDLFLRPHIAAGQDGFREVSSKQEGDCLTATDSNGVSHVPDRSIKPPARFLQDPTLAQHGSILWLLTMTGQSLTLRLPKLVACLSPDSFRRSPSASRQCVRFCSPERRPQVWDRTLPQDTQIWLPSRRCAAADRRTPRQSDRHILHSVMAPVLDDHDQSRCS